MNDANLSVSAKQGKDVFAELVELVFMFIHEHYRVFNDVLDKFQINYSQYAALLSVYMYKGLSEGELARMLHINPSTVSRMVYSLEEKGWLKSTRDKADRRKVIVSLSPTGKKRIGGILRQPAEVLVGLTDGLAQEKREYVYAAAAFINQALKYLIEAG